MISTWISTAKHYHDYPKWKRIPSTFWITNTDCRFILNRQCRRPIHTQSLVPTALSYIQQLTASGENYYPSAKSQSHIVSHSKNSRRIRAEGQKKMPPSTRRQWKASEKRAIIRDYELRRDNGESSRSIAKSHGIQSTQLLLKKSTQWHPKFKEESGTSRPSVFVAPLGRITNFVGFGVAREQHSHPLQPTCFEGFNCR